MIHAKQKNLRIFEFQPSDENALWQYIERNKFLLQGFLLLLPTEPSSEFKAFLQQENLIFMDSTYLNPLLTKTKQSNHSILPTREPNIPQEQTQQNNQQPHNLYLNRIIRSGEEIHCEGSIIIYGRVNSGARIYAKGDIQIYGNIDGIIECEGNFMILTQITHGSVLFGGEIINPALFDDGKMRILTHRDGILQVQEIQTI